MRAENAPHLLLLAGSGESRALAQRLAQTGGLRVTASLLHQPRTFGPMPVPTRLGRFGGVEALRRFLVQEQISAVLDATHPFSVQMGHRAAEACAALGLGFARVLRPPWPLSPSERWAEVADEAEVRRHLREGDRVFATTGRATLDRLVRDVPAQFLVRQMAGRDGPCDFKNVEYIYGKGPFSVDQEVENLGRSRADVLVAKNSGGTPSHSKLAAADALGLRVVLIARPPQPPGTRLETVEAAMQWVARL